MALKISEITAAVTDITKETLVEVSEKTDDTYATKKFNLQGLAKASHTHGYGDLTGVAPSEHTHTLNSLSDVVAPTVAERILAWDGEYWRAIEIPTGGGGDEGATSLAELSDVSVTIKSDGDALVYVENDSKWKAVNLRKVNEVVKSSTTTLTVAEVTGTIINNYGQTDNITLTLPTAAKGLTFMVVLGTTATDKYFHIEASTNDKIYLSGIAGSDGEYVGVSSAEAGNTISFTSFQTGTDTYDWLAVPIAGDWEAES